MEKEDLLSSEKLDFLKNILAKVCPSLTKRIDMYERETSKYEDAQVILTCIYQSMCNFVC